ncbi:hypothetical protein ACJRO7_008515 [Eucalyptus globulus]|uniref:Nodulin-like protein n=1 Tax=Eucalyptus globulus TaxID=34317 RepID=A0ABD3IS48_EUCGL
MERRVDNKWASTIASIWIQASCGASYTFGIYSSTLKSSQSYSQSTLDTVSVFKDIGANAGVISGLFYSAVTEKRGGRSSAGVGLWPPSVLSPGPWLVLVAGAVQFFAGYFFIWASVVGLIDRPPTFFNTTNVVSGVHNFSDYSGTIVGIMKCNTVLKDQPSAFILMLAILSKSVSLVLMLLVRIYDTNAMGDKKHLNSFSAVALIIATYLMILIILENTFTMPLWSRILTFIVLLFLLFWPLRTAIVAMREEREGSSEPSSSEQSPLLDDPLQVVSKEVSEDMNLIQAMRTGDFWLLFMAMVCGLGSGLATINNISQIGESLGYTTVEINTLVSLLSIWNFLGRFGAGYISDVLLYKRGFTRPFLMAFTLLIMAAGHIIIASGFSGNLYVGSVLVGVCYGCLWSLMPTITSEIFGVGHMGTIFNTIAIGSPVGSYILSVRVIGYIYDKEATGEDNSCYGTHCFMLSFFILASVAFFGFLVDLVLFFCTRSFYKLILHRRSQHSQLTAAG